MEKKIRICFVGCGGFCNHFVPLFQAHPAVEFVAVCDLLPERAQDYMDKYHVNRIFATFEEALASSEINSIAIFTQRHLHGPMAIAALKAGKNVYSAVPMASTVEEIAEIVRLVGETRLTYSMGETGHYRPCSIFCRQKMQSGETIWVDDTFGLPPTTGEENAPTKTEEENAPAKKEMDTGSTAAR